jgi:prevent-host-death family protein
MLSVRPFLWHNKATKGAELMPEIIPIRDLKNTNAISQRCHETQEPIFVTKSGYGDMVIMSIRAPRMLSGEFFYLYRLVYFSWRIADYIDYYNNSRIQAKTKWMPPSTFREASMMDS